MRLLPIVCLLALLAPAGWAERITLPFPGREAVTLDVRPFRVVAADARFVVVDERGEHVVEPPAMRFFRGKVVGEPDSRVTLSLRDGRYEGAIQAFGESWVLGGSETRRVAPLSMSCDGADLDVPPPRTTAARAGIDGGSVLVAPIAVEATVDWFNRFAGVEDAQAYLLNTMAVASTFMSEQVNVRLEVPYLRLWTAEPDPYTDGSQSTVQLLDEMTAEWNANQTDVERATAHLFSYRPFSAAGRAYIDQLCDHVVSPGDSLDYGVTTIPIINNPFESYLVSHELAHNFGSPHTQCYVPPIDTCATEAGCWQGDTTQTLGTLMSNCNQFDPVFHPRVKAEKVRPGAEAAFGSCLFEAAAPGRLADLSVDRLSGATYRLAWGAPCNASEVPGQDFAVYQGTLGAFGGYAAASCSTAGAQQWSIPPSAASQFFLVVPATASDEGSYGLDGAGRERAAASAACKSQSIAYCAP